MKKTIRWSSGLILSIAMAAPMVLAQTAWASTDDDAKSSSRQIRRSPSPKESFAALARYRRTRESDL